jgi:hypothetical protein
MVGVDAFLSNERLVYYAFPQLKKVASGTDEEAKEWLRLILSQAGDTPEKRALTDLLGKP